MAIPTVKTHRMATSENRPTGYSTLITNCLSYGPAIQLIADFQREVKSFLYTHKGHSSVHDDFTYGSPNEDGLIKGFHIIQHSARVGLNCQHEQTRVSTAWCWLKYILCVFT